MIYGDGSIKLKKIKLTFPSNLNRFLVFFEHSFRLLNVNGLLELSLLFGSTAGRKREFLCVRKAL